METRRVEFLQTGPHPPRSNHAMTVRGGLGGRGGLRSGMCPSVRRATSTSIPAAPSCGPSRRTRSKRIDSNTDPNRMRPRRVPMCTMRAAMNHLGDKHGRLSRVLMRRRMGFIHGGATASMPWLRQAQTGTCSTLVSVVTEACGGALTPLSCEGFEIPEEPAHSAAGGRYVGEAWDTPPPDKDPCVAGTMTSDGPKGSTDTLTDSRGSRPPPRRWPSHYPPSCEIPSPCLEAMGNPYLTQSLRNPKFYQDRNPPMLHPRFLPLLALSLTCPLLGP